MHALLRQQSTTTVLTTTLHHPGIHFVGVHPSAEMGWITGARLAALSGRPALEVVLRHRVFDANAKPALCHKKRLIPLLQTLVEATLENGTYNKREA